MRHRGRFNPETGRVEWHDIDDEPEISHKNGTLVRRDPGNFVARQEQPSLNRRIWHRVNKDGEALINGMSEARQYQDAVNRAHDKGLAPGRTEYDAL